MAIKLYRCPTMWLKIGGHPCWKVQKALDEQGIDYEVVKGPLGRGKRDDLERISGQRKYPVIEFENGSVYRAESKEMAEKIRSGKLFEEQGPSAAQAAEPTQPT
jgi:glutathione S-transferase